MRNLLPRAMTRISAYIAMVCAGVTLGTAAAVFLTTAACSRVLTRPDWQHSMQLFMTTLVRRLGRFTAPATGLFIIGALITLI